MKMKYMYNEKRESKNKIFPNGVNFLVLRELIKCKTQTNRRNLKKKFWSNLGREKAKMEGFLS